jgi:hypothetical protein
MLQAMRAASARPTSAVSQCFHCSTAPFYYCSTAPGKRCACILTISQAAFSASGCLRCFFAYRDLINNKQHQQLAPLAASLYYHAAFTSAAGGTASGSGPAASSGPAATAAVAHEVGSCGSTGDGLGAQVKGKRRASSAEVAATPAAARTAARGGRVSADDGSSDDEVLQLPRKRSRVLGPAEQLLMHLQADPDRYAQCLNHVAAKFWLTPQHSAELGAVSAQQGKPERVHRSLEVCCAGCILFCADGVVLLRCCSTSMDRWCRLRFLRHCSSS